MFICGILLVRVRLDPRHLVLALMVGRNIDRYETAAYTYTDGSGLHLCMQRI